MYRRIAARQCSRTMLRSEEEVLSALAKNYGGRQISAMPGEVLGTRSSKWTGAIGEHNCAWESEEGKQGSPEEEIEAVDVNTAVVEEDMVMVILGERDKFLC